MLESLVNKAIGSLPTQPPKAAANILDLFSLKGKVASVTGSSGGIGWAVAEGFAQAGADVALWYNSHPIEDKTEHLAKTYGVRAKAYKCNLSDHEEVDKVVRQIEQDFGRLDVFVANAGVAWTEGPCIDVEGVEGWKKLIDLDLNTVYYCAKAAGRIFKKNGKGSFVITASMSGHAVNIPQLQAPYNAAKAALLMLNKSLAVEWAPFARVNSVSPGYIRTSITEHMDKELLKTWYRLIPLGRQAEPRELVGAYLYLASDASSYTTGTDILVDGGYTAP